MSQNELAQRLAQLRSHMRAKGAQWSLIRATDIYLNEYVPKDQSRRVALTGFTGSMGDAVVGLESATLFVDGRYALQAKDEALCFDVQVLTLGESIENACLRHLADKCQKGDCVLIEDTKIPQTQFESLQNIANAKGFTLHADDTPTPQSRNGKVWAVETAILGTTLAHRLSTVGELLERENLDAYLLVALDDIAWISGFRGLDFAFQSTFAARALVLKDELRLITSHSADSFRSEPKIRCFERLDAALAGRAKLRVGYEPSATPVALLNQLANSGAVLSRMSNPVQALKVHKGKSEIDHLVKGFKRADDVVYTTQNWVCEQVLNKKRITESDVYEFVSKQFATSGAIALSFTPICGYAKNGAVIHHSNPDKETPIEEGELFLLDTGGIYEGGYSTDLTRTFLVGGPNTKASRAHKQMFTLVLKAAIIGMSARIPEGTTGVQLDAMVRAPLWQMGLNFAHGTGHGLGINVHEFPPRIATFGFPQLEVGHVFSIEPGLYIPDFGGVRIENLCTLVKDPAKKGFLRVVPLTFAPLDERLIEYGMLSEGEKQFLNYFKEKFTRPDASWNALFPLDDQPLEPMLTR